MRTEKVWQPPSIPTETGRIPEVRERKGKNQRPAPRTSPPALVENETEDEGQGVEEEKHLDTLA
ncbi:hypothetical protein [Fervidibacter sp.]|jgi:hypothetical protein|nr:hypothetical protein [Armatimonadota bacterium]